MKKPFELMAEIQEKNAEIASMAKLAVLLKVDIAEKDAEIEQLKALLARAAEALENKQWNVVSREDLDLIAELRKAAE